MWFSVIFNPLRFASRYYLLDDFRQHAQCAGATAHPTAEWIAQQITEAFPWTQTPRYLIRGRDAIYGAAVTRRKQRSTRSQAVRHIAVGAADLVDPAPINR